VAASTAVDRGRGRSVADADAAIVNQVATSTAIARWVDRVPPLRCHPRRALVRLSPTNQAIRRPANPQGG
jgi:hypothetical protein